MMESLSQQKQPSVTERAFILFNAAKKWEITKNIPESFVMETTKSIVLKSKEYSLMGYHMFGKQENETELRKCLLEYKPKN